MSLVFCFIGGCPGFSCVLISVSLMVRFLLKSFSKLVNILSFSDWSVILVILSIFRMVQINSRSQSIRLRLYVFSFGEKQWQIPSDSSTFRFYHNLSSDFNIVLVNVLVILFIVKYFFSFIFSLSGGIIVTGYPVSTTNTFSIPSIFIAVVLWFFR